VPEHRDLRIVHATGVDGARQARGTVVVIDVLRSFSVSAYALAGGALECRLVPTVDEARALAERTPGAVLCAEEGALPIEGIAISNSPTQIRATELGGRVLVQRSSAGTPVVAAVRSEIIFAASLVVARATVQACLSTRPEVLTLVASADFPEDHACAQYMAAVALGREVDLTELLRPLYESERYSKITGGGWPGFPASDLELSLTVDLFPFAMPVTRHSDYDRLTRADQG
jgi:2-phosphosulfolactate phosphatase